VHGIRRLFRLVGVAGAAPLLLIGHRNRIAAMFACARGQMAITSQMI
jgi:hypothetical protein